MFRSMFRTLYDVFFRRPTNQQLVDESLKGQLSEAHFYPMVVSIVKENKTHIDGLVAGFVRFEDVSDVGFQGIVTIQDLTGPSVLIQYFMKSFGDVVHAKDDLIFQAPRTNLEVAISKPLLTGAGPCVESGDMTIVRSLSMLHHHERTTNYSLL